MHKTRQGYHFRLLKWKTQSSMVLYYHPLFKFWIKKKKKKTITAHFDFAEPRLLHSPSMIVITTMASFVSLSLPGGLFWPYPVRGNPWGTPGTSWREKHIPFGPLTCECSAGGGGCGEDVLD